MRVIALVLIVGAVSLGGAPAVRSVRADGNPPPFSQCYTVTISPPVGLRPSVTVCQP